MLNTVHIENSLHRRAKACAALEGRSLRAVIEGLLQGYVGGGAPIGPHEATAGVSPGVTARRHRTQRNGKKSTKA